MCDWFGEHDVSEVVLFTFDDLEGFFELRDPFLEIVVVDEMAVWVLETCFTCLQGDTTPVFALGFFAAVLECCESPEVMFFEERFTLVPCAATGGVEEALGEEFGEESVFFGVFFEAAEWVKSLVDDAGVDPCWGETA